MLELLAIWPGQLPASMRASKRFGITVLEKLCVDDAVTADADVILFASPPSAELLTQLHDARAESPIAVVLAGAADPWTRLPPDFDGFVDLRWPTDLIDASLVAVARHVNLGRNVTQIQQRVLQEARVEAESLYHQAVHDSLTGLYNRRHLDEILPREHERARRTNSHYAIVLMDVDDLKAVNTEFGHSAGSAVLRATGSLIAANVRLSDYAFRYGGDEFLIFMTHADESGAQSLAGQLLEAHANQAIVHEGVRLPTSISVGVASYPLDGHDSRSLFERADAAMFVAKGLGKHRVVTASTLTPRPPRSLANH